MDSPEGLNGLVFGTEDSAATYAAMQQAGVPVFPPGEFSRPVALPDGTRDAVFRTVRLMPGTVVGRTPVFLPSLHPRPGLAGRVAASRQRRDRRLPGRSSPPAIRSELGALFGRMFGADAVRPIPGGLALTVGVSRFDVVTPDALARRVRRRGAGRRRPRQLHGRAGVSHPLDSTPRGRRWNGGAIAGVAARQRSGHRARRPRRSARHWRFVFEPSRVSLIPAAQERSPCRPTRR